MDSLGTILGTRWAEIDTDALRHNTLQVMSLLKPPCRLLAVVKADAYGLGAVECARVLLESGVSMLGVTLVEEGRELREAGIDAPILVFAPPTENDTKSLIEYDLTATVTDLESAREIAAAARERGRQAKVHVKIDTGFGRLGVTAQDAAELIAGLLNLPGLVVEGVYSHAASGGPFLKTQADVFADVCRAIQAAGWDIPLRHFCNSMGTLLYPQLHYDMVRVGTLLYGQIPDGCPPVIEVHDPWKVKARILQVREMPAGSRIGYGRGFRLRRNRVLAVVGTGYSDGLALAPVRPPEGWLELIKGVGKLVLGFGHHYQGPVSAYVRGKRVPLVGRLSMQLAVVDVTEAVPVQKGQEVLLDGVRRTSATARMPRMYLAGGRPYRLRWLGGDCNVSPAGGEG